MDTPHNAPPLCPSCLQPASVALAGHAHGWECRNEACPVFGQEVGVDTDHGTLVLDNLEEGAAHQPAPTPDDA